MATRANCEIDETHSVTVWAAVPRPKSGPVTDYSPLFRTEFASGIGFATVSPQQVSVGWWPWGISRTLQTSDCLFWDCVVRDDFPRPSAGESSDRRYHGRPGSFAFVDWL